LPQQIRHQVTRFAPPIVLAVFAAIYLSQGKAFTDPTSGQAPSLYGHAMLIMAALVVVVAFIRSRSQSPSDAAEDVSSRKIFMIFAIIAGFIALIFAIGFYAAIPVFLFSFLMMFARMRPWLACVVGLAAALLVWGIFGQLLHMRVFSGYLF
jgi:uncharacterized protein YqhQ